MNARRRRALGAAALGIGLGGLTGACAFPVEEVGAPVAAVAGARPGGSITVAITPPGAVDPVHAVNPPAQLVVGVMCDTLVTVDAVTGDVRPGLVESWIVADGGRSVSFKLRRNARFPDGSKVTSKEVVDSLRRLADPAIGGHAASLLADVAGYEELRKSVVQDSRTLLRGVRAIEPLSFEVLFASGKHPDFVRALAHPATAPVPTDAADEAPVRFAASPTCSGPYRLAAPFTPGDTELRLVRNATAGGSAEGMTRRGAGYADEIVFRVVPDAAAAYEAWRRGEVDVAAVPPDRLGEARRDHPASLVTGPAPRIEFIGLPGTEQFGFAGVEVRRALAAALDREAIARDIYAGSRVAATGFLPPSLGRVARPDACRWGEPRSAPSDVVLPSAPLTLAFNDEFAHRRLAEAVAGQWRERLGLDVRLQPLSWDDFLAKGTGATGFDSAFRVSWQPRYASGLEYLGPLFHSRHLGATNLQRVQDIEFDRAFDLRAAAAVDERERELELQRLEDRLCRELPLIPLAFSQSTVAVRLERLASARDDNRVLSLAGDPMLRELYVR